MRAHQPLQVLSRPLRMFGRGEGEVEGKKGGRVPVSGLNFARACRWFTERVGHVIWRALRRHASHDTFGSAIHHKVMVGRAHTVF